MEGLENDLIKSTLWLERLRPETQIQMEANFKIAQKEIIAFMSTTTNKRLIDAEVKRILKEAFSTFETILEEDVRNITETAYNATGAIMTAYVSNDLANSFKKWEAIETKVQNKIIDKNRLLFGTTWEEHKQKALLDTNIGLRDVISKGFKSNDGIAEISRNINNTFKKMSRNSVKGIVKTSMFQAINEAKSESFANFDDVITEYYYSSVMDSRTTFRCFNLNLTASKNKQDIEKLLNYHWNCRSMLGARTDFSDRLDKDSPDRNLVEWKGRKVTSRKDRNPPSANNPDGSKATYTKFKVDTVKKIAKDATPEEAFSVFGESYQKDFLGKGRYNLWKSGRAKFDDMFDISRNTPIPLKDLKKKLGLD